MSKLEATLAAAVLTLCNTGNRIHMLNVADHASGHHEKQAKEDNQRHRRLSIFKKKSEMTL